MCKNLFPQCKTPLSQFTEIYSEFRFNLASEVPAKTPKRCIKVLFSKQILYTGYLYTAIISTGVSSAIWKNKHLSVFQRPQIALVNS